MIKRNYAIKSGGLSQFLGLVSGNLLPLHLAYPPHTPMGGVGKWMFTMISKLRIHVLRFNAAHFDAIIIIKFHSLIGVETVLTTYILL